MLKKTRFILFVLSFALVIGLIPTAIIAEQFGLASEEETRAIENPPLASGVYRINSLGTDSYLETQGGLTSGSAVTLAPDDGNTREQLYKVVLVRTFQTIESDNLRFQYVIRPMTNNGLALYAPTTGSSRTTSVVTASASDSYSSLSSDVLWEITEDSGALLLSNDLGTSFLKASNGTPTVSSGGGADAWWQFEAYTGSAMEGIATDFGTEMIVGYSYHAVKYSTVIGENDPSVFTSVINPDGTPSNKLTVDSNGILTATSAGTVQIVFYLDSGDTTPAFIREVYIKPTISLRVFYDNGYNTLLPGASNRIIENLYDLQAFYDTNFNIWIAFEMPYKFTSYADQCPRTVTEKCDCAGESDCYNSSQNSYASHHHKNMYNVIYRPSLMTSLTQRFGMVFTGHILCKRGNDNKCKPANVYGACFESAARILINCTESQQRELATMVHELGHMYGVIDHYNNPEDDVKSTIEMQQEHSSRGYDRNCIYGENKDTPDVYGNLVICDGCISWILENQYDYCHPIN